MCTYNGERYLEEQLDSIAAQSRQPLELIVCDDQSTDTTLDVLKSFASRCHFPVHIHRNETRLGSTRNFDQAMRMCKGTYIALSDQDDRWRYDKLEQLAGALDRMEEVSLLFTDANLLDSHSAVSSSGRLWKYFGFSPFLQRSLATNAGRVLMEGPVVTGATVVFRRKLLTHFPDIPEGWVHDEWLSWMAVFWGKLCFIAEPLTDYRLHSSQQLGVADHSIQARFRALRATKRQRYRMLARRQMDLIQYLSGAPKHIQEDWSGPLTSSIRFLEARAAAPMALSPRLLFLAQHFRSYHSLLASTPRSLLADFLMGRT